MLDGVQIDWDRNCGAGRTPGQWTRLEVSARGFTGELVDSTVWPLGYVCAIRETSPPARTSHLSIGLAVKALEQGHRVYFRTLHDLVTRARQARRRDQLHVLLRNVLRADLFLLDELGFLPLEAADSHIFLFEVINKRHQASKPTIVTSNKSFGQWNEIFPTPPGRSPCSTACSITSPGSTSAANPIASSTAVKLALPPYRDDRNSAVPE